MSSYAGSANTGDLSYLQAAYQDLLQLTETETTDTKKKELQAQLAPLKVALSNTTYAAQSIHELGLAGIMNLDRQETDLMKALDLMQSTFDHMKADDDFTEKQDQLDIISYRFLSQQRINTFFTELENETRDVRVSVVSKYKMDVNVLPSEAVHGVSGTTMFEFLEATHHLASNLVAEKSDQTDYIDISQKRRNTAHGLVTLSSGPTIEWLNKFGINVTAEDNPQITVNYVEPFPKNIVTYIRRVSLLTIRYRDVELMISYRPEFVSEQFPLQNRTLLLTRAWVSKQQGTVTACALFETHMQHANSGSASETMADVWQRFLTMQTVSPNFSDSDRVKPSRVSKDDIVPRPHPTAAYALLLDALKFPLAANVPIEARGSGLDWDWNADLHSMTQTLTALLYARKVETSDANTVMQRAEWAWHFIGTHLATLETELQQAYFAESPYGYMTALRMLEAYCWYAKTYQPNSYKSIKQANLVQYRLATALLASVEWYLSGHDTAVIHADDYKNVHDNLGMPLALLFRYAKDHKAHDMLERVTAVGERYLQTYQTDYIAARDGTEPQKNLWLKNFAPNGYQPSADEELSIGFLPTGATALSLAIEIYTDAKLESFLKLIGLDSQTLATYTPYTSTHSFQPDVVDDFTAQNLNVAINQYAANWQWSRAFARLAKRLEDRDPSFASDLTIQSTRFYETHSDDIIHISENDWVAGHWLPAQLYLAGLGVL